MQIGICAVQRFAVLASFIGAFTFGVLPARAATIEVELRSDNVLIDTLDETDLGAGCTLGGAIESCTLTDFAVGDYLVDLSLLVGENSGNFGIFGAGLTVDNTGVGIERLTVDIILDIGPLGPATSSGGSVAPALTDGISSDPSTKDNSATLATVIGSSFYTAEIDGTLFSETLYDDPQSLVTSSSASFPGEDFGLPGNTLLGPAVGSTIRIRYDFTLTPEDQASMSGQFVLTAIPEPGTALLLGLGLIGLARVHRRR